MNSERKLESRKFMKLATKANFFIIGMLSIIFLITGYLLIDIYTHNLAKNVASRGAEIAVMFARINSDPMMRMEYYSLENNVKELLKIEDIVFAQVFDATGTDLTPSGQQVKTMPMNDIMVFHEQIIDNEKGFLGTVKIGLSIREMHADIRKMKLLLAVIMLATTIAIFLGLNLTFRFQVNKPIELLLESVNTISEGNLAHRVKILANDEIGTLANRFNQMSAKLKESSDLVKNSIESMPSMFVTTDGSITVTQWNSAAVHTTAIPAEKAIGKNLFELFPYFQQFKSDFEEIFLSRKSKEYLKQKFNPDDETYYNITFFPLISDGVKGIVIRIDDVTELEKKETQLRHAQKMETIGNLAGGLAHDFNNVLGGIIGTLSLIEHQLNEGKEMKRFDLIEYIKLMSEASARAADLVKQLQSISRRQKLTMVPVDLNLSLKHVMKMCQTTMDKSIELLPVYAPVPAMVHADPTQIEQVLLNLCINASHAMTIMRKENSRWGGKLTVKIEKVVDRHELIKKHQELEFQDYWQLSVEDTGVGMNGNTIVKIFDPFFSTKNEKGTGLGLTMVYNIIKQHKGVIDVFSQIDAGSIFSVILPFHHEKQEDGTKEFHKETIPLGDATVLIVDDEAVMRRVAKSMLEKCGYKILLATNGEEGVAIYRDKMEDIDLVLMDVVMPKKSGMDAYMEIKTINPAAKVLLMSGLKKTEYLNSILEIETPAFVQKPFDMEILSRAVYDAIKDSRANR